MTSYLVTHRERPSQVQKWTWVSRRYENKQLAIRAYNELLPGPNGSFGPILYENIALSEILAEHKNECLNCDDPSCPGCSIFPKPDEGGFEFPEQKAERKATYNKNC